jgi:hypothetical protein
MPRQDTVSIVADAAPEWQVYRQPPIDGRLVAVEKTFASINSANGEEAHAAIAPAREMGAAGLEEFLESKAFAVPVVGGDA